MKHQVAGAKLNRDSNHRKQLFKTMISQLVLHGSLTTTISKAKLVKQATEKILNKAKENTVHIRRQLIAQIGNPEAVKQMMDIIAPRLGTQAGGFVKAIRQGKRRGDNTMIVTLELGVAKAYQAEQAELIKKQKAEKKTVKSTKKTK